MKPLISISLIALGTLACVTPAHALTCANGVYRAGCTGPNGAVVGRKPYAAPPTYYRPPAYVYTPPPAYYRPPAYAYARPPVSCANGPYRAGCVGPNGAVVGRKPYPY